MTNPTWVRSSYCSGGNCPAVAYDPTTGRVLVRDTKLGADSPVLSFTAAEWAAFVAGVKDDQFAVGRLGAGGVA